MPDTPHPDDFAIRQSVREDGKVLVSIVGEIDLFTSREIEAVLGRLARGKRHAVLDLSEVQFIDSTGLSVIIGATRESRRDGWSFALAAQISEPVIQLFELTGVCDMLPFEEQA
jgi:anti-sigma B factor antagonist